jgi:hypothetical protein
MDFNVHRPKEMHMRRSGMHVGPIAVLALALAAGCASPTSVRVNADPGIDLASYTTFGYFEPLGTDRAQYSTLVSEQLKASTTREMQARGYAYSATDPDLLINFSASLADKLRVTQTPVTTASMSVGRGWGGGYYGYRTGLYSEFPAYETNVTEYQEGTLNIDLVDARQQRLVWEGIGVRSVSRKTLGNISPALDDTVGAIFKKFPIEPR